MPLFNSILHDFLNAYLLCDDGQSTFLHTAVSIQRAIISLPDSLHFPPIYLQHSISLYLNDHFYVRVSLCPTLNPRILEQYGDIFHTQDLLTFSFSGILGPAHPVFHCQAIKEQKDMPYSFSVPTHLMK